MSNRRILGGLLAMAMAWPLCAYAAKTSSTNVTITLSASASIAAGGSVTVNVPAPYTSPATSTSSVSYESVAATPQTITVDTPGGDVPTGITLGIKYDLTGQGTECGTAAIEQVIVPSDATPHTVVSGITNSGTCTASVDYKVTVTDITAVPQSVVTGGVTVAVVHTLSE